MRTLVHLAETNETNDVTVVVVVLMDPSALAEYLMGQLDLEPTFINGLAATPTNSLSSCVGIKGIRDPASVTMLNVNNNTRWGCRSHSHSSPTQAIRNAVHARVHQFWWMASFTFN